MRLSVVLLIVVVVGACADTTGSGTSDPPGEPSGVVSSSTSDVAVAAPTTTGVAPTTTEGSGVPAATADDSGVPGGLSLEVDGFQFVLEAVDAECVVLTTSTPDGEVFIRDTCPSYPWVDESRGCLTRPGGGESDTISACDVEAPTVIYGRATGDGYLCMPSLFTIGIGRVRFIPFNDDGLYFAAVDPDSDFPTSGDGSFMFDRFGRSFTSDGDRIDPFKEDFETPIFELCERLAPWDTGELGPSDDLIYRGDIEYRADAANDLDGRILRFDFGPGGRFSYNNGEVISNDLAYLPYPVTPTLTIRGAEAELVFDPVPDLSRVWRLVITLAAGAVAEGDDGIVIDPEFVTLTWEEG